MTNAAKLFLLIPGLFCITACRTVKSVTRTTDQKAVSEVKAEAKESLNKGITLLDTSFLRTVHTLYAWDTISKTVYKTDEYITEIHRGITYRDSTVFRYDTSHVNYVDSTLIVTKTTTKESRPANFILYTGIALLGLVVLIVLLYKLTGIRK